MKARLWPWFEPRTIDVSVSLSFSNIQKLFYQPKPRNPFLWVVFWFTSRGLTRRDLPHFINFLTFLDLIYERFIWAIQLSTNHAINRRSLSRNSKFPSFLILSTTPLSTGGQSSYRPSFAMSVASHLENIFLSWSSCLRDWPTGYHPIHGP